MRTKSKHLRQRPADGAKGGNRLCTVRADFIALQAQLLHLADRALAKSVAQGDGTRIAEVIPADQNFGQRPIDQK